MANSFFKDIGAQFANDFVGSVAGGLGNTLFGGISARRNWKYQQKSMALQQEYNLQNMAKQFEYQQAAWNAQNEYNDPRNAAARYRAAGISPVAALGNGGSGVGVAGSMSTPDSSNPSSSGNVDSGYRGPTMTLAEAAMMRNQRRLTDADVNLKDAQAREANSRAQGNENLNSIFDLTKQLRLEEIRDKRLQNDIRDIQKGFEEARNIKDIAERDARISKLVADTEKVLADKSLTEDNRKVLQSIVTLNNAQSRNADASAAKSRAETQTENETRSERLANLVSDRNLKDAQSAVASADEWLKTNQAEGQRISNDLESWISDRVTNREPTESYYKMALDVVDRYLQYRGQELEKSKGKDQSRSILLGLALRFLMKK